jgi:hypothetical protein
MGGGGGGACAPLPGCVAGGAPPNDGARNVVYPEPSKNPGRAAGAGASAGACRTTTFPIKSVPVTVTFASSEGAFAHPKTVHPPFSS